jgi:molecular chaperone GrpE (heat shock protein)
LYYLTTPERYDQGPCPWKSRECIRIPATKSKYDCAQGLVPRSELFAAHAEAKSYKDEVQTKQGELARLQSQLNDARYEAAQLQAAMSAMVSRAEVEQERARAKDSEAVLKDELLNVRAAGAALNDRIGALEAEKSKLITAMQVRSLQSSRP